MNPEDMLEQLQPIIEKKAKKLYLAWMLTTPKERADLEVQIRALYVKHIKPTPETTDVILPGPDQETASGQVEIGTVLVNKTETHKFYLRENELCQHIAVFGRTGSGKTNTVRYLLASLLKIKLPFLIFDWKKDYSELDFKAVFGELGIGNVDISVLPVGKRNVEGLRLNPLIPPKNTAPQIWAKQLCELLTHSYMGGPGFESLFLEAINHCYEKAGTYQDSNNYPTFADIRNYLTNKKCSGREALWMQSVMRTINNLCFPGMNETINAKDPHDLAELLGKNVVLELDALGNADKTFLVEVFLLWLHHHRLSEPPRRRVDNVVVVEEAHHLLRAQSGDEETLVESSLREMRSLGVGIIIIDQMPSLISKVAMANTYCTIALNVKTGQDVNALSNAMLLNNEAKTLLGKLPVGTALVKLQDRYLKPFVIKTPLVKYCERKIKHYKEKPFSTETPNIPQQENKISTNEDEKLVFQKQIKHLPALENQPTELLPSTALGGVSEEQKLLQDIAKNPTDTVTTRYKRLGWTSRKGNHQKNKLIKNDLIEPVTFAGLKGWRRLFKISPDGEEVLRAHGIDVPGGRLGGLEHRYWTKKVKQHYESKGYSVTEEELVGNHPVDLVARNNSEVLAIEIETGKSNIKENIETCIESKVFTQVIVVCTCNAIVDKAKQLQQSRPEKARVVSARDLLK